MEFYCFGPNADDVNTLAYAFLNVFWSGGVGESSTSCDDVLHCLFSPQRRKVSALSNHSHFLRLSIVHPIPVLSLFSVRKMGHASLWPGGSYSFFNQARGSLSDFSVWSFFLLPCTLGGQGRNINAVSPSNGVPLHRLILPPPGPIISQL